MQCNAAPLKQPQNKFSCIFILIIAETTRPGYAGTITKLQIVLNAQNNPSLSQAT